MATHSHLVLFESSLMICCLCCCQAVVVLGKRQCQRGEARKKIFLRNPYILLNISLLWLPFMFLLSLENCWLRRLFQSETMDFSSWNVGHVLKTAWKWSSWSLIWEQDGTNVSFISHIHVRFLSCVISFIVLPTLPSPSSDVLLIKLPNGPFTP